MQAMEDNKTWRLIFGFPLLLYVIIIFGFMVVIRYDSPTYYVARGDTAKAREVVHQIYKTEGNEYLASQIVAEIETKLGGAAAGDHAQRATFKEAYVTDERYVRASWVNFIAMIFHELTAINIIMAFSNTILEDILGTPSE